MKEAAAKLGWGTVYGALLAAVAFGWKFNPGLSLTLGSAALGAVQKMREAASLGTVAATVAPGAVAGGGLMFMG